MQLYRAVIFRAVERDQHVTAKPTEGGVRHARTNRGWCAPRPNKSRMMFTTSEKGNKKPGLLSRVETIGMRNRAST
jgi:hypothetical protein